MRKRLLERNSLLWVLTRNLIVVSWRPHLLIRCLMLRHMKACVLILIFDLIILMHYVLFRCTVSCDAALLLYWNSPNTLSNATIDDQRGVVMAERRGGSSLCTKRVRRGVVMRDRNLYEEEVSGLVIKGSTFYHHPDWPWQSQIFRYILWALKLVNTFNFWAICSLRSRWMCLGFLYAFSAVAWLFWYC